MELLDMWLRDTADLARKINERKKRGEDVTEDEAELRRLLDEMERYEKMRQERRA